MLQLTLNKFYKWEKENIRTEAYNIEFKITENAEWAGEAIEDVGQRKSV